MFAAMLFLISTAALTQFAIYYWRAVMAGAAAQPVSARVLDSVHAPDGRLAGAHFPALAELLNLTPDLHTTHRGLGLVRAYYATLHAADALFGKHFPGVSAWSAHEQVICARYAAVQIDRRLQANLALSASLRSC
jgi:hypothetical protein